MIGAFKHDKALEVGVDIICAQGGEGGGHTGEIATSILLPKVVDQCHGRISPLTGGPVLVVGAGGIFDGRGLAMALAAGCTGVWVGTRFIACDEAGAGPGHKRRVVESAYEDTMRTIMYSGRPMRIFKTPYSVEMEEERQDVIKELQALGIPAWIKDMQADKLEGANLSSVGTLNLSEVRTQDEIKRGVQLSAHEKHSRAVFLTGQCAGAISDIQPAKDIIEEMVSGAADIIRSSKQLLSKL